MTKFLLVLLVALDATAVILMCSNLQGVAVWFIVGAIFLFFGITIRVLRKKKLERDEARAYAREALNQMDREQR